MLKKQGGRFGRGKLRRRLEPIHDAVGQRDHENQKRKRKGSGCHPLAAKEKKTSCCEETDKRKRHERERIVLTRRWIGLQRACGGEQCRESSDEQKRGPARRGNILSWELLAPDED